MHFHIAQEEFSNCSGRLGSGVGQDCYEPSIRQICLSIQMFSEHYVILRSDQTLGAKSRLCPGDLVCAYNLFQCDGIQEHVFRNQ